MSQEIIKVVPTPNPDAYMFRVNETLVPTGTYEFSKGDPTTNSPLAERLMTMNGVLNLVPLIKYKLKNAHTISPENRTIKIFHHCINRV